MTTSNNTSWDATRNQIIEGALRKIGRLQEGQTPSTSEYTDSAFALNGIISLLATDGMPLWKRVSLPVALTATQVYTIPSAVKVTQVVLRNVSGTQYDLIHKSLYDFNRLPVGSENPATPVHYTYQPKIQDGTLTIWPQPDTGSITNYSLVVVYQKEFDGFFTSTETPDFPSYWIQPIIYQLAVVLAPEYGLPLQDRQQLMKEAQMYKDMASGYSDEDGSLYFAPDAMSYGKR